MKKTISLELVLVLALAAEVANADYTFGEPTNMGPIVNSAAEDWSQSISADGLSLYIISDRPGGYGNFDIWVATRATTDDAWDIPVNLGPIINTPVAMFGVSISSDGLSLYFDRGGVGDIWLATRATTDDDWSEPVNLGSTVNSSADDWGPNISADDLSLYFTSKRPGGYGANDLWVTTRATTEDDWGTPVNLGPTVNSSASDSHSSISVDGRTLFFGSSRPGGYGEADIWVTTRATTDDDWRESVNLGSPVNSSTRNNHPTVSADGSTLFFRDGLAGYSGGDIWQAPIVPIVDLSGDGIVDSADMCMIVDHWGEDYSLCDIGPMPWGDGIVDVQDLIVLAGHIGKEVYDPTLIAHWALDETEGMFVADSVGGNDGYALGDPVWLPDGGRVDGALEFDGVDDFISAPAVLNPADGPFSVLAWVKGGAAGQAIIATPGGPDWLSLDPVTGHLMTELASAGRDSSFLLSETTITDGNWHRIGLVWDGLHRTLVVDGVAVAEDTQNGLQNAAGGLYIGTGKAMAPGTFFSGMIDDVRIYNRAINP
ncbi:MAG: LamG-like jellyroll fold domain-containing protein [Planctomycetota bacterium]